MPRLKTVIPMNFCFKTALSSDALASIKEYVTYAFIVGSYPLQYSY